jgi:hypothetical protein
MRQLIYSSRWTDDAKRDMDLTLQQIVGTSIQNNRMVDVTGFLLARDGLFMQLLEGPQRAVGETFKRISADPRHTDVRLIADVAAQARLFQQWNMAGIYQTAALGDAPLDAEAARALLRQAAAQERERERQLILGAA